MRNREWRNTGKQVLTAAKWPKLNFITIENVAALTHTLASFWWRIFRRIEA